MQTFVDTWRNRFILSNLVAKEFKALYRSMALGFCWALLQPLVMVSVLTVVFVVMWQQPASFPAMVIVALVPYNFLSYTLTGSANAILANRSLVKKVRFPRQLLPMSVVVTNLAHFGIQSILVIALIALFPPDARILGPQLAWLPLIFAVHLGLAVGLALLVSGLNVVYRDVKYIVESGMTVLFWMSPILYSARQRLLLEESPSYVAGIPDALRYAYYLNPVAGIVEAYRNVLYLGISPDPITFALATAMTLAVGAVGMRAFWIHEKRFADLV